MLLNMNTLLFQNVNRKSIRIALAFDVMHFGNLTLENFFDTGNAWTQRYVQDGVSEVFLSDEKKRIVFGMQAHTNI